MKRYLLLIAMSASAGSAFGKDVVVKNVFVAPEGNTVRLDVQLSAPVKPVITRSVKPCQLIIEFPGAPFALHSEYLTLNRNGVSDVRAGTNPEIPANTRIVVEVDEAHPYVLKSEGNNISLSILPGNVYAAVSATHESARPAGTGSASVSSTRETPRLAGAGTTTITPAVSLPALPPTNASPAASPTSGETAHPVVAINHAGANSPAARNNDAASPERPAIASGLLSSTAAIQPEVSYQQLNAAIEEPEVPASVTERRIFKVKFISGNTVYIDGGSNSGLRSGMSLEILSSQGAPSGADQANTPGAFVASIRVVGVAATSAITEVSDSDRQVKVGDAAELISQDAAAAASSVRSAAQSTIPNLRVPGRDVNESSSLAGGVPAKSMLSSSRNPAEKTGTRMAGRIGLDYSSITSGGSTPGTSTQRGISFQSDMTNILGTHWNLQGYWRGRINDHSQFREPTLEESLNKTYTMQLYYDNPRSRWLAGVGRLYLPWAVSLDTIDGGYLGRKLPWGITTGVFAGSTPDLNSWHYRPNQRIGGSFINFQGGDYERVHYTSTAGVAVNTLGWKVDRPMAFFENEVSYKGMVTVYHSLIADTLRGYSTSGMRLPPGISHSYFTAHYLPNKMLSFDVYHNYFRDVPTATTTIVGTGLVDRLLFQGLSGGVHVRPLRNLSLYTTLGASEKTGDTHRSLNQMYGVSWSEIARSGIRADVHYSKFDSNFGKGDYKVVSLSRQVSNRAFWNVQVGKQDLLSYYTSNHNSLYISDSLDVNLGRRSYLQSGYTYVNGATMNYRQLYFSWGFRFDGGKKAPEFVQTQGPVH